tara:strand:- start:2120 stop:2713 length:594 start_codon:yes stop_codon:yes gene_type:complete
MKILKEYKEPTTIIICGAWVEGIDKSLMITDDESQIDVRGTNGSSSITTLGQVYILTEDEFNWFITSDHYKMHCEGDVFSDIEHLYIPIKDYVGVIGASGLTCDNEPFDNWDINNYFHHQVEDSRVLIDVSGEDYFIRMNVNEVKEFLVGAGTNGIFKAPEVNLEEKIVILEKRIESQQKQIEHLSDAVDWCERNIK